jgi:transposase, IS5 family
VCFNENIHDSKTLPTVIAQYEKLNQKKPKAIYADRGYRGPAKVSEVEIFTPKPSKNISKLKVKNHRRRAAIEPIIGHLKHDYRLKRNYLKGTTGDAINLLLSAAAMNFKRVINLWLTEANFCWKLICKLIANIYQYLFAQKLKMTF